MSAETYDPLCEELAEHFLPGAADKFNVTDLAKAIQGAVEDWLSAAARENPASEIAIREGCTCRWVGEGNDPDAHVRTDQWCPLHGRDPDAGRQAAIDDGEA
jgi:hypothetical protein